jgi:hypothetical protein
LDLPELFTTAGEESFARLLEFRAESLGGRLTDPLAGNRAAWDPALFERREIADWQRAILPQVGRS